MNIRPSIIGLVSLMVLGNSTPAMARTPMGRAISGVVQMTNRQSREVVMRRADTGGPLSFVWIDRTVFVVNRQVADVAILKKGARIEVVYHHPFFGRPFVTKVTLLSAANSLPHPSGAKRNSIHPGHANKL